MAPGNFPIGGVRQNDGELGPKVAPRRHSQLLFRRSAVCAGRRLIRGLVDNVLSVAIGQLTCACSHQVESRPYRPVALLEYLRTIIETGSRSRDKKIRQVRPDLRYVTTCRVHHSLLSSSIGSSGGWQLASWRVKKGGLIGEQL